MAEQGQGGPQRTRAEMEQALAASFGYPDYASFQQGVTQTLGKGVLRRLEKQLDQMESSRQSAGGPRSVAEDK